MKLFFYLFFLLTFFTCSSCKKKSSNIEDQLPPETTTGAMTFGCKVNGKVFVPKDGRSKPGLYCQYVYFGTGLGGGWYLNIPATNWVTSTPEGIGIGTDSLFIKEGTTYFFSRKKGYASAFYQNGPEFDALDSSGQLTISKFDLVNHIISGTFFFKGTNTSNGNEVNITEGRFDVRY